jgi:hypothetical protein
MNTSPLPRYAGCELLDGRARWLVPTDFDTMVFDNTGHDFGDEHRYSASTSDDKTADRWRC